MIILGQKLLIYFEIFLFKLFLKVVEFYYATAAAMTGRCWRAAAACIIMLYNLGDLTCLPPLSCLNVIIE